VRQRCALGLDQPRLEAQAPWSPGAAFLAHQRPGAVVDLRLFARIGMDDREGLRPSGAAQPAHKAAHAAVAAGEAMLVDQLLVDRHPDASVRQGLLDHRPMRLAGARLRLPLRGRRRRGVGDRPTGRFCRCPWAAHPLGSRSRRPSGTHSSSRAGSRSRPRSAAATNSAAQGPRPAVVSVRSRRWPSRPGLSRPRFRQRLAPLLRLAGSQAIMTGRFCAIPEGLTPVQAAA